MGVLFVSGHVFWRCCRRSDWCACWSQVFSGICQPIMCVWAYRTCTTHQKWMFSCLNSSIVRDADAVHAVCSAPVLLCATAKCQLVRVLWMIQEACPLSIVFWGAGLLVGGYHIVDGLRPQDSIKLYLQDSALVSMGPPRVRQGWYDMRRYTTLPSTTAG